MLRLDFNDDDDLTSSTQPGWIGVTQAGSSNLDGTGISLAITAVGTGVFLDDRVRTNNAGGMEPAMWKDFIFAAGSNVPMDGMDLRFTGFQPLKSYAAILWAFDKGSPGLRTAIWNGSAYSFDGMGTGPASLSEHRLDLDVTSDASGVVVLMGRSTASAQPHNVFLSGMEISTLP